MTIDLIVNAMMPMKVVFHIFQQGPNEGTPSFEKPDQVIRNISKDINVTTKTFRTKKRKEHMANPKGTKVGAKVARK